MSAVRWDRLFGKLKAAEDAVSSRIEVLKVTRGIVARKVPDGEVTHLICTLLLDAHVNGKFDGPDGDLAEEAKRLYRTACRLAREAGYAVPESSEDLLDAK